ncbi:MAG: universal stress protein, partial [Bacteroidota bacterium]
MKHILLPTDFSDNAWNAINYGISLFEKETCMFYVLHAYQTAPSGLGSKFDSKKSLEETMEKIHAITENPLHTFEKIMVMDVLSNAIGKTIIDKEIDYVIMGTKGSSAVKEIFMGSSAVTILKKISSCPIILVPKAYEVEIPKEMVLLTNFKHFYEKKEVVPLLDIQQLGNSTLLVVYIKELNQLSEQQMASKEILKRKLQGTRHKFYTVESFPSVSEVAHGLVKENRNIGLIAMLKSNHGFLRKLIR